MKEEKEGILHIIFIFIGICLICLGTFYAFTDNKTELEPENNNSNNNVQDKDIIGQINLTKNMEALITFKNNKIVKLRYITEENPYKEKLLFDGSVAFVTSSELEACSEFYIYNNSVISYCYYTSATSGHLYIVDSNGKSSLINKFDNDRMIPESIQFKDNKLIVNGMGIYEGSILKVGDKEIYLCNEEEVQENNVDLKQPAYADYELVVKDDKPYFIYIKTTKSLENFIKESCKMVE